MAHSDVKRCRSRIIEILDDEFYSLNPPEMVFVLETIIHSLIVLGIKSFDEDIEA